MPTISDPFKIVTRIITLAEQLDEDELSFLIKKINRLYSAVTFPAQQAQQQIPTTEEKVIREIEKIPGLKRVQIQEPKIPGRHVERGMILDDDEDTLNIDESKL